MTSVLLHAYGAFNSLKDKALGLFSQESNPPVLSESEQLLAGIRRKSTVEDVSHYISEHQDLIPHLSNEEKLGIIFGPDVNIFDHSKKDYFDFYYTFSEVDAIELIEKLRPTLTTDDLMQLTRKFSDTFTSSAFYTLITQIPFFSELFSPTGLMDDLHLLSRLYETCAPEHFQDFWQRHKETFLSHVDFEAFKTTAFFPLELPFLNFLYDEGFPAELFNTLVIHKGQELPGVGTWLQAIASRGYLDFFQKVANDLPRGSLVLESANVYKDEMLDCVIQRPDFDYSQFNSADNPLILQNGCRAVVITDKGATSYPGVSAAKIAQETLGIDSDIDTLRIYHNKGHASLSFSDGTHYGYYPASEYPFSLGLPEGEAMSSLVSAFGAEAQDAAMMAGFPEAAKKLVAGRIKIYYAKTNAFLPCTVNIETTEGAYSAKNNQVMLTLYSTTEKTDQMRAYVGHVQGLCKDKDPSYKYQALTHNCIDWVQEVIEAGGHQGKFRDGISTMQYLRRLDKATVMSLFQSGPVDMKYNQSIDYSYVSKTIDQLPRENFQYAVCVIGAIFMGLIGLYFLHRALQKVSLCFHSCRKKELGGAPLEECTRRNKSRLMQELTEKFETP